MREPCETKEIEKQRISEQTRRHHKPSHYLKRIIHNKTSKKGYYYNYNNRIITRNNDPHIFPKIPRNGNHKFTLQSITAILNILISISVFLSEWASVFFQHFPSWFRISSRTLLSFVQLLNTLKAEVLKYIWEIQLSIWNIIVNNVNNTKCIVITFTINFSKND